MDKWILFWDLLSYHCFFQCYSLFHSCWKFAIENQNCLVEYCFELGNHFKLGICFSNLSYSWTKSDLDFQLSVEAARFFDLYSEFRLGKSPISFLLFFMFLKFSSHLIHWLIASEYYRKHHIFQLLQLLPKIC